MYKVQCVRLNKLLNTIRQRKVLKESIEKSMYPVNLNELIELRFKRSNMNNSCKSCPRREFKEKRGSPRLNNRLQWHWMLP